MHFDVCPPPPPFLPTITTTTTKPLFHVHRDPINILTETSHLSELNCELKGGGECARVSAAVGCGRSGEEAEQKAQLGLFLDRGEMRKLQRANGLPAKENQADETRT